jgi:hypothetical protein
MKIFYIYLAVAAISVVFGILLCIIFRGGLKSFISTLFSESQVQKFWAKIIYAVVMLASVSGALSNTYPESAKEDQLILTWAVMDQLEAMLFRLLWVFLILFTVFLVGWAVGAKKK